MVLLRPPAVQVGLHCKLQGAAVVLSLSLLPGQLPTACAQNVLSWEARADSAEAWAWAWAVAWKIELLLWCI